MGYLKKSDVIDAIHEDLLTSSLCYGDIETNEVVEFCYHSMEREIDRLPQYMPENVIETKDKCKDCAGCTAWKCDCANIRAEAINEFAKKLTASVKENYFFAGEFKEWTLRAIEEVAEELNGVAE